MVAGVRRAVRLEALAARRRRVLDQAVGRLEGLPGDQRPPRRRPRPPARAGTSTPRSREIRQLAAAAQRGWAGPRARVRPRLHAAPRPRRAAGQRRPGLRHPDRRPDRLRHARGRHGAGRGRRHGRGLARPHRRRRRPTCVVRGRRRRRAGPPRQRHRHLRRRGQADQRVRRPRPGHRGRRPQRRRPQRPGGAPDADRPPRRSTSAAATAASRVQALGTGWGGYNLLVGAGDLNGDGQADLLARDADGRAVAAPGHRAGALRRRRSRCPATWGRYSTITGFGDFNGDGRPDLFARRDRRSTAYVLPARGDGTFGHPLGPVTRLRGATVLVAAADLAGDRRARPGRPRTGDRLVVAPQPGHLRDSARRSPTGVDLPDAEPAAQRRRLGPRRPRRPHHPRARRPARCTCGAATAPASFAAPVTHRHRLRQRRACWPRSAT